MIVDNAADRSVATQWREIRLYLVGNRDNAWEGEAPAEPRQPLLGSVESSPFRSDSREAESLVRVSSPVKPACDDLRQARTFLLPRLTAPRRKSGMKRDKRSR